MTGKIKGFLAAFLTVIVTASTIGIMPVKAASLSPDEIYSKAYYAVINAVNQKTQKSINEARKAISALNDANMGWAVGEFSKQVDQIQHPFLVNIISAITKAQAETTQMNINAAKAAIDPDMPDIWKNSYSSAVDLIQQQLMQKAVDAYNKANDSKSQADKDYANKMIEELKTAADTSISNWAKIMQEQINAIQVTDDNNSNTDKNIIQFKDSELEKLVRKEINKPTGFLYKDEVEKVTKLYSNGNISRLDGIEYLTNLNELYLSSDIIADFTPLEKMKKLETLSVKISNENNVHQLENLSSLSNLFWLEIYNLSSSKELESLTSLTGLAHIQIYDSNIDDYSALKSFKYLFDLKLSNDNISDISFLKDLTSIKDLDLSNNYIEDLSPISQLDLRKLVVLGNKIKDIKPIANMKNLSSLNASYNFIEDISSISNCTNLNWIAFDENYIKDISYLQNLKNLNTASLSRNIISDISVLGKLNNLSYIYIYGNPIVDASPIASMKLKMTDNLDVKKIEQAGKAAHSIINSIINNSMSDLEKEKAIYSYVMENAQYDYKAYETGIPTKEDPGDIYGTLICGYAVCDGYAHAMKVLGRLANLDIIYITGNVRSIGHAWNMINIAGSNYQLDATWDDGGQDIPSSYKFFNISDEDMAFYGYRSWDRKMYPKAAIFDNNYIDYCTKNGILINNYKTIKGTIYTKNSVDNDMDFVLNFDVKNKKTNEIYNAAYSESIKKGQNKCDFEVKIPGDENLDTYYLSYEIPNKWIDKYLYIGYYSNGKTEANRDNRTSISVSQTVNMEITSLKADPSKDINPSNFNIEFTGSSSSENSCAYTISAANDFTMPAYSAILYYAGYEDKEFMESNPLFQGSGILKTNHQGSEVKIPKGTFLGGNPSITRGMNIYYKIIIFSKDFNQDDIFNNSSDSSSILHNGNWVYGCQVPIGDIDSLPKGPITGIVDSTKVNGNILNFAPIVEESGYTYTSEIDAEYNYSLVKVNVSTSEKTVLASEINGLAGSMQILGDYLYYTDDSGLNRINLSNKQIEKLLDSSQFDGGINRGIYVTTKGIFYESQDGYKLYKIDVNTRETKLLLDHQCQDINVVGNYIYYINSSNTSKDNYEVSKVYKYNIITGEDTKVSDNPITKTLVSDGKYLYYSAQDINSNYDFFVYKMNFDGSNTTKICKVNFDNFNVENGNIYGNVHGDGVYKISTDGRLQKINSDTDVLSIIIGEQYIYEFKHDCSLVKLNK